MSDTATFAEIFEVLFLLTWCQGNSIVPFLIYFVVLNKNVEVQDAMILSSVFKLKHNLYLEETHYVLCINHVTLKIQQTISNRVLVNLDVR